MIIKQEHISRATEDIIVHQVNCVGQSGLIAKSIYKSYPDAEKSYKTSLGKMKMLKMNPIALLGEVEFTKCGSKFIASMFTQSSVKKKSCDTTVYTDYRAMRKAFKEIATFAKEGNYTVAIPYGIGTGAPNGKWKEIEPIITEELKNIEYTYYKV